MLASFYGNQYRLNAVNAHSLAKTAINRLLITSLSLDAAGRQIIKNSVLSEPEFEAKYRADLEKHKDITADAVRRAVLLDKTEFIKATPPEMINIPNSNPHEPMLFYGLDDPKMTQLLIAKGVSVDAKNGFGKTALMYAAQWNLAATVDELLAAKVDVNMATIPDNDTCEAPQISGRTALMYAAENASFTIMRELMKAGADMKAKDSNGRNLTAYAVMNAKLTNEQRQKINDMLSHN